MMNPELKYWLAVNRIEGLNWQRLKFLLEQYKSIKELFSSPPGELLSCGALTKPIAKRIIEFGEWDEIDEEIRRMNELSVKVITIIEEEYPGVLRNIYDPPPVLYCLGRTELLRTKCMAVVGTRHPTEYGIEVTQKLTTELVEAGYTIVSGFAQGIDAESHLSAIRSGGNTIAVFGSGVDVVYPAGNMALYEQMSESQLIISEFPMGTKPFKINFPKRNRIISGLSEGVIVMEATLKSGSLITARCALEQNRDVFAVPGMITSTRSQGCHYLIKEGARPVESINDITGDFNYPAKRELNLDELNLKEEEKMIVKLLKDGRKHIDIIIESVKIPSSSVTGILTVLELNNIVRQLPGKYFELKVN